MRPCTCARRPTDTHTSSRTRSRAREGNFLTTNLLYSIVKPSSIITPTLFTSIIQITVQSISILAPHWLRHLYKLSLSDIICRQFTNYLPTIRPPSNHLSLISHSLSPFSIISSSPFTHHILSLSNN